MRFAVLAVAIMFALACAAPVRAWDEVQQAAAREAGDCVSWSQNRIDCLARSPTGSLSWIYREQGNWSTAQDLGGKLAAAPSCIVRGPGGINCFAISAKGVLATIYLNGKTWGKWASLGGELKPSRVACVALARDRIACFARGRGDQLMSRRWSGGKTWEPWRDLGGALSADPECIVVGGAGAACFGRSPAGELIAFLPDAAGKSGGWTTLGGHIEGKPSCVRLKSGEAACVAQSRSGRMHTWRGMPFFAQNAGLTTSIDDEVTSEPACALQGATLVCFTRNSRRQLVRRSLGAGADTSHDGVVDAPQAAAVTCLSIGQEGLGCALTGVDRKLHFGAGQDLLAGAAAVEAQPPSDDGVEGNWFLSNLTTGSSCRVQLSSDLAYGAKLLRAGRCRAVGMPSRPAQWDQDDDALLFLAADGRIVLRFQAPQAGRWVSQRRGDAFMLTREPPDDADAVEVSPGMPQENDSVAEMFGAWRVAADRSGDVCTIRLTTARVEAGFALRADPDCDPRFAGVRYWTENAAALVFIGPGNVILARFDSAGPSEWRSPALGGLTLTR